MYKLSNRFKEYIKSKKVKTVYLPINSKYDSSNRYDIEYMYEYCDKFLILKNPKLLKLLKRYKIIDKYTVLHGKIYGEERLDLTRRMKKFIKINFLN